MTKVFQVSRTDYPSTRLHLPDTPWSRNVRRNLTESGYLVSETDQDYYPDTRPVDELARVDELLSWAAPD